MEPVYHDGDYLYFHFTNSARSGTDVVCSTIHGAVVKRMGEDGGLYSVNPERPFQMKTEADNVRLLGVVTGVASPEDWPSPAERDELSVRFQAEERDFRRKYRLENWE
jgi:SOS-response transcriptional repressor LexA